MIPVQDILYVVTAVCLAFSFSLNVFLLYFLRHATDLLEELNNREKRRQGILR